MSSLILLIFFDDKAKFFQIDTDSIIIHNKMEDFLNDIKDDLEKRFYTPNYEVEKLMKQKIFLMISKMI